MLLQTSIEENTDKYLSRNLGLQLSLGFKFSPERIIKTDW